MPRGPVRQPGRSVSRRQFMLLAGGSAAGFALLSACQASPSSATSSGAAAPPSAAPAQATSAAAPALSAARQQALAPLIAGARQEGSVVVYGPVGTDTAAQLPQAFEKQFGVTCEYTAGDIGSLGTRLASERPANVYSTDIAIGGAETQATAMWNPQMHDPIKPILVDPDVTDPTKWKTGKVWFLDPDDQYILRITNYISPIMATNSNAVGAMDLTKTADLLDPKWNGQFVSMDPRLAGSGSNIMALFYVKFGEDFVRKLYVDQNMTFVTDNRTAVEDMARGADAIELGAVDSEVSAAIKEGLPVVDRQGFDDLPGFATSGTGLVALLNKAPHPNAAQLFVNWLAGPEALDVYARTQGMASNRTDLDESWVPDVYQPQPGADYFDSYDWDFTINLKPKARAYLKSLVP